MHKREIKWSLEAISNQLVPTSSSPEAVLTESILCDKLLLFFGFLDSPHYPPTKAYVVNEWSLCNHVINWCLPLPPLRLC